MAFGAHARVDQDLRDGVDWWLTATMERRFRARRLFALVRFGISPKTEGRSKRGEPPMTRSKHLTAFLLTSVALLVFTGCRTTVVQPVQQPDHRDDNHDDHRDDHNQPPPPDHHDDRPN